MMHPALRLTLPPLLSGGLALAACTPRGPEPPPEASGEEPRQGSELTLPMASAAELEDAILALRVRLSLLEQLRGEALGIDIGAEDATIVLSGTVGEPASRMAAVEICHGVDGVDRVTDRMALARHGPQHTGTSASDTAERAVADAVLLARVKLQLAERLGASALDIDAEAAAGIVRLKGMVRDEEERSSALAALESVGGVLEARDELQVTATTP